MGETIDEECYLNTHSYLTRLTDGEQERTDAHTPTRVTNNYINCVNGVPVVTACTHCVCLLMTCSKLVRKVIRSDVLVAKSTIILV